MTPDLSGKSAIVTGAAHGFGRAICVELAQHGAHVWALDIVGDELEDTERLCMQASGRCEARVIDITDVDAVQALVQQVCQAHGQVDILVNNAGGVLGQVGQPLEAVTPAQWKAILDVT
jgi:3-oxoacyl-[acyl-carrier protein] reductase